MTIWIASLLSVSAVSLVSLVGVMALTVRQDRVQRITLYLVSFAAGGLFGDALIHLLPESFARNGPSLSDSLLVIAGILIFFVLEKVLRWRHCHVPVSDRHVHPVVAINLVSDALHNFIDGALIGASYLVSLPIGVTTTVAVILHEIPQEIGDTGVLAHGGLPIRRVILFNFLSGLVAVLGTILVLAVGPYFGNLVQAMLPVTAGGFLYIAGSDLVPELHHEERLSSSIAQFGLILLGVGIMALLTLLE
ncbi:MAG TPA: ZIP family metal transporter [bacterium]|nr:ZIP family metal transporter [bacterium]